MRVPCIGQKGDSEVLRDVLGCWGLVLPSVPGEYASIPSIPGTPEQ